MRRTEYSRWGSSATTGPATTTARWASGQIRKVHHWSCEAPGLLKHGLVYTSPCRTHPPLADVLVQGVHPCVFKLRQVRRAAGHAGPSLPQVGLPRGSDLRDAASQRQPAWPHSASSRLRRDARTRRFGRLDRGAQLGRREGLGDSRPLDAPRL